MSNRFEHTRTREVAAGTRYSPSASFSRAILPSISPE